MTADNLDSLSEQELNEAFAVEVCKIPPGVAAELTKINGQTLYCTYANVVLPWLEKQGYEATLLCVGGVTHVRITGYPAPTGIAPTFAKAACIALLRASRSARD